MAQERGLHRVLHEHSKNDDKIVFVGEYLNGKRNGKGKEYNSSDKLIFEGEYLNGKRTGKGIEYDYLGWIMFEGDFLKNLMMMVD